MIVKVQLSLATNAGARQVLVYNQSRTVRYEGIASAELIEAMDSQRKELFVAYDKAFFNATIAADQYLDIDFQDPVPDQGW